MEGDILYVIKMVFSLFFFLFSLFDYFIVFSNYFEIRFNTIFLDLMWNHENYEKHKLISLIMIPNITFFVLVFLFIFVLFCFVFKQKFILVTEFT